MSIRKKVVQKETKIATLLLQIEKMERLTYELKGLTAALERISRLGIVQEQRGCDDSPLFKSEAEFWESVEVDRIEHEGKKRKACGDDDGDGEDSLLFGSSLFTSGPEVWESI